MARKKPSLLDAQQFARARSCNSFAVSEGDGEIAYHLLVGMDGKRETLEALDRMIGPVVAIVRQ